MKLKKLNVQVAKKSRYLNLVVRVQVVRKQAITFFQLELGCGSVYYPNFLVIGSQLLLAIFAVSQAHADDNIATFGLPNQPKNSTSLVISQSYQPIEKNAIESSINDSRTNTESITEPVNSNNPNFIKQFTNTHTPDFQYAEVEYPKIKTGSTYKKIQPKVVMVDEPYPSDSHQDISLESTLVYKSRNIDEFDNTGTQLIAEGNFVNFADVINTTNTITIDNTPYDSEVFSINKQKSSLYSPLNAISPNTLKTFVKVVDLTRNEYVRPVSDEALFESAMKGMLKNLDAHAEFLNAQSYENLQAFTQGEVAQVGILANYDKQVANWKIVNISQDSPAEKNGIQKGYFLHQIDGVKLKKSTSQHDVNQLLSGMAGTMVDVIVSNAGRRKNTLTLQRTESTKTAVSIVFDRGIAVIKIPVFQNNTRQQILDTLVYLGKPINGVVLDLQDNPGGVVESAIEIAGLFQKNMPVIQTKNRQGQQKLLTAKGGSYLEDVPIVILQNRYSASAAEILASAIQSNKRGSVVGEISYGKGTVQSVIPIDDEQAVKLTVAYYLSIDGRQVDGIGVHPDITLISDVSGQINPDDTSITSLMSGTPEESLNTPSIPQTNIDSQNIQKKWQQQAVDILLEQNNYNTHIMQEARLTQLAKLNQQNRQLRKSVESVNNGIGKGVVENDMNEVKKIQQELQELQKATVTSNGVLLAYPKSP